MSQSQISRTLRDEAAVARIASILSQERFDSRSALGRRICEEFSFADARGRPQLAGCMKALGALTERVPDIVLPPPKASAVDRRPRLLKSDVPEPEGVPAHPTRILDLGVAAVADAADRVLWNTLIAREHPHGTTFAGCQVRYLVGSAHGWLGAAGFAAAALRAAARDGWIGWDDAGRRGHLQRVVCLSRLLIRPSVRCPHSASHVLDRILRRLPGDFEERYGFRPYLVESFADEGYDGTCLRAANFLCVGRTAGRGRQDREKRRAETVKTVFVHELERSWRRKLGVPRVHHAPSLEPELFDGDSALVDHSRCDPVEGEIFALRTLEGPLVKRLRFHNERWWASSDNDSSENGSRPLDGDDAIIGRVVWWAHTIAEDEPQPASE